MAFSDIMRLNIGIYTLLDQNAPEVEINHPHNIGVISLILRNWRHYEGLQKHQEDGDNVKFYSMEDLKHSNNDNDLIPNIIKDRKEVKSDEFVKENQMINIYPKNSSAHNLANEYYQEIYDYLTKKPGERYPKRLEKEIDKNKKTGKVH